MSESDNSDPFKFEQSEFDPAETSLRVSSEKLADLSDQELARLERAASTLADYEQAAAKRERATTERANAIAAQENARAKRVFLERISKKFLPYAGFLIFGFIPLVAGMTQILQYTDIRLWVGSGLLGLGLVIALALLALGDWERISSRLNRYPHYSRTIHLHSGTAVIIKAFV